MIGNKNIRRGLMAVFMTVSMVFPLAGCGNEADADDVEDGSDCIDVQGDFTADECRIKLHDGRTVTGLAAQAPSFKTGVSRHFFD